jgi:DNA-binding HxlR family transcriptional regulator
MDRMTSSDSHRSGCALSSALDLIGDKWSLLILRGLFVGWSRYREFLAAPEGISTNILANRLKRLEASGLIAKLPDGGGPKYRLTRAGADLLPAMQALAKWGHANLHDRWAPPEWFLRARPEDFYPNDETTA